MPQENTPQNTYPNYDDEISLVDLIKIIIKRKKLFWAALAPILALGLIFSFVKEPSYKMTTVYTFATVSALGATPPTLTYLEDPTNTLEQAKLVLWPDAQRAFMAAKSLKTLPEYIAEIPRGTSILSVSSKAPKSEHELISELHKALIEPLAKEQNEKLELYKNKTETQLAQAKDLLKNAQAGKPPAGALLTGYLNRISNLEDQLDSIKPGRTSGQAATLSEKPTSISQSALALLSLIVSFTCAFILVFTVEFYQNIKAELK